MDNRVYNYLQSLLPNNLQFVESYQEDVPIPLKDWVQMNILSVRNIGRSIERQGEVDTENKQVQALYDIEQVYKIQFDFYGNNAFSNASIYLQTLQVNLDENTQLNSSNQINLKTFSEIRNLTDLLENKKFLKRYNFDIELYVIQTISKQQIYLDKMIIEDKYIASVKG